MRLFGPTGNSVPRGKGKTNKGNDMRRGGWRVEREGGRVCGRSGGRLRVSMSGGALWWEGSHISGVTEPQKSLQGIFLLSRADEIMPHAGMTL